MTLDGPEVAAIREACWKFRIYASPNLYLRLGERQYDASLMIDSSGELLGVATNTKGQLLNLWEIVPNRGKQTGKPPQMGVALEKVLPFFCSSPFFLSPLLLLLNVCQNRTTTDYDIIIW